MDTNEEETVATQLISDVTGELFEGTNPHELADLTDRFKAIAHLLQFAILYRLRDADGMSAKELSEMTDRSRNALHSHLDKSWRLISLRTGSRAILRNITPILILRLVDVGSNLLTL